MSYKILRLTRTFKVAGFGLAVFLGAEISMGGDEVVDGKLTVNGSFEFLTGFERMLWSSKHSGTSDHRNYLAPSNADGSSFDWNSEFGFHSYHRAWYFDSNLGIGTYNPQSRLHIQGPFAPSYMQLAVRATGADDRSGVSFWNKSNQRMGHLYLGFGDYILANEQSGHMRFFTGGSERVRIHPNGNVGIGTTLPEYKLEVEGSLRAEEIIVSTEGADFVFNEGYKLMPIGEVEAFIRKHGHLPAIPSAEQMQTDGVGVSELQTKLLQKVEELTLYVIELKKENDALKTQMSELLQE